MKIAQAIYGERIEYGETMTTGVPAGKDGYQVMIEKAAMDAIGEWEIKDESLPLVQRLRLEPGDVIVVSYSGAISYAEKQRIIEVIKQVCPDNRALILECGMTIATMGPEL